MADPTQHPPPLETVTAPASDPPASTSAIVDGIGALDGDEAGEPNTSEARGLEPEDPATLEQTGAAASPSPARGRRRRRWRRVALAGVLALVTPVLALTAVVAWAGRGAHTLPLDTLTDYAPPQTTRVLDRDGRLLGELTFGERRTVIAIDDIPEHVQRAFLAAEDSSFFRHRGLDLLAMVRAAVVNVTSGELRQGASTITQQVIKNVVFDGERSFEIKSQEIMLASRVELALGKRRILEIYLNEIYLGEGRWGVEAASQWYFGKSVRDVDVGEAALLAALPKAPSHVSPYRNPRRARARQLWVLSRLLEEGWVPPWAAAVAMTKPLTVVPHTGPNERLAHGHDADEILDLVQRELAARFGDERLATLGATVTTTVDLQAQRSTRAAVRAELDELERRMGVGLHARRIDASKRARVLERAPGTVSVGEEVRGVVDHVDVATRTVKLRLGERPDEAGGPLFATVTLPDRGDAAANDRSLDERFPIGAAWSVKITSVSEEVAGEVTAAPLEGPQAAVVFADVSSGALRVWVGGREGRRGGFDRVRDARRQPGSAFKPIVWAAALARDDLDLATLVPASPPDDATSGDWSLTLRAALAVSNNVVAQRLTEQVGIERVVDLAHELGIESPLEAVPSLALGAEELAPLELLRAYTTLATGGLRRELRVVDRVEADDGSLLYDSASETSEVRVLDPSVAFLVTSALRSVVDRGTALRARRLGTGLVGKTGTTNDSKDVWFAAYTPRLAGVVWIGFDTPRSLGARESGGETALPVWMRAVETFEGVDAGLHATFVAPDGVTTAWIDDRTGAPACRQVATTIQPARCTFALFWETCTPQQEVPAPRHLECGDPSRWFEESFLARSPGAAKPTRRGPWDPFALASTRPPHPGVELEAVRIFRDDFSAIAEQQAALGEHATALTKVASASFAAACDRDPGCAGTGRHIARVRVAPGLVEVLEQEPSAPPGWTNALRWALAEAAAQAPTPAVLQRPASWGGAGELELVVSATPPGRAAPSAARH